MENMEISGEKTQKGVSRLRRVTPNMAGFLFWTTLLGVVFLLIGFVVPGWLSVVSRQEITDYHDEVTYDLVHQDYAIWYVTQCTWALEKPYGSTCETRSYRLLELLDERRVERIDVTFIGRADLFFSGRGLVFSESEVRSFQTFYTLGTVAALVLLAVLCSIQGAVSRGNHIVSVKKKVFLVILALVSGVLTFVPVGIFTKVRGKLHQPSKEFGNGVKSQLRIIFAGVGGAIMLLLAVSILLCFCVDCSSSGGKSPDRGREEEENRSPENKEKITQQVATD